MTRAKGPITTTTTTHSSSKGQHPRMCSSSSSSSISSSSPCPLSSPGPQQQKTSTTTMTTTVVTAKKRSSWMLSNHEKPGWEDTAATPLGGQQQHQQQHHYHHQHESQEYSPKHSHKQHQRAGSYDQAVVRGVALTSPHSPPSSPLPLGLHKQNATARAIGADMDSEDDHHRRYKQLVNGRAQAPTRGERASVTTATTNDGGYSSGHSASISYTQKAAAAAMQRPRRKEGSISNNSRATSTATTTTGSEISTRPRFSVSTVVNPRPQVYSIGATTREVPKEVSTKTSTTAAPARSSRSSKDSNATPRIAKSTTIASSTLPTTKSISTTRVSKTRLPTTITTTTTTTTRRVASTVITMGPTPPHLDREHHRKLTSASSAVVTNAGALSTKTSSSSGRKERIARASNVSPAGKAVIVRERRQNAVEPNIDRVDTISTSNSDTTAAAEHNCNGDRATAEQLERGTIAASALTTIPLLPALQMEGEEEPPIVDATLALSEVTTDIVLKNPSLSSSPPPQLTAGPVQILSSPLTAASHPQTPPPPLTQKAPSAVVCQVSETAFITTCSLQKEVVHAATQAQRQGTTEARLTKPPAVAVLVTTSAYTPPAYLSATPRIFRALRDVTNPRVLAPQQQQQKSAPQVETKSAGEEQQRPTEVLAASVPVTLRESELVDVIPNNTAEESSEAPSTLTIGSVKDGQKAQQRQQKQQPFRKSTWTGRMDTRFNKPQLSTTTTMTKAASLQAEEEAVQSAQKNTPRRASLLATMDTRTPLTKAKDPVVMLDLMTLMKARRDSWSFSDDSLVESDGGSQARDRRNKATRSSSRTANELWDDNDNDTTNTNNHNNTNTTLPTAKKITLEDKKAYLKTQEMRRRSIQCRSQTLTNDLTVSPSPSPYSFFPLPTTASPPSASVDSLSVDAYSSFHWEKDRTTPQQSRVLSPSSIPAMSVAIPLKVATVLQGMGYPINNTNTNTNTATSPLCSSPSPSPSPSPVWSAPSTPRLIPSSVSSTSLSSLSSSTSTVSSASSYSSVSSSVSSSSKTLPLSFPDRLFHARSPGTPPSVVMMPPPRSFSPRPARATSITGAGTSFIPTGERYPYYSSASSTMLPSLPSPALSLTVPERQQQHQQKRVSNRPVDIGSYFRPRLFSGSRSEDEQSDTSSSTRTTMSSRQHHYLQRPFEKASVLVPQQQHRVTQPPQQRVEETIYSPWPAVGSSMPKSASMPHPLLPHPKPPSSPSLSSLSLATFTDQDQEMVIPLDTQRHERIHERSNSASSIDRSQQYHITKQEEELLQLQQPCDAAVTQDISFLTKRLANLQLMDSLCPVPDPSLDPQQGPGTLLDSTWAMQIQLLLAHLAEQTDLEQESRLRPLPLPPRPLSLLLSNDNDSELPEKVEGVGLYRQVLTDWLLRLDQLSTASSTPSSSTASLYKDHPGLKREVEKIRWQHNVPSKAIRSK